MLGTNFDGHLPFLVYGFWLINIVLQHVGCVVEHTKKTTRVTYIAETTDRA